MKGNFYRLKGRHLSVTLLVLTFTTIVLWAWEKNPFVTTLWSAQEQFNFHTSDGPTYAGGSIVDLFRRRKDGVEVCFL